jgi:hypothetical protein
MRTRMRFQTRPSTHPEVTEILGDLAGPYVKEVSPNCKNLVRRSSGRRSKLLRSSYCGVHLAWVVKRPFTKQIW